MSHRPIAATMAVLVALAGLAPVAVFAAVPGASFNAPGPAVEKMASSLGVTGDLFAACVADANPMLQDTEPFAPASSKPTALPKKQVIPALLPCLKDGNSSITSSMLKDVLNKYELAGPGSGEADGNGA